MTKPDPRNVPALKDPRSRSDRKADTPSWHDQVATALEARRVGAELRRGRPKSFRPVVGRV